jgi:hypothetical protein
MANPGATPLMAYDNVKNDGQQFSELQEASDQIPTTAPLHNGTPDKIVVYLAFPEHLRYILPVG